MTDDDRVSHIVYLLKKAAKNHRHCKNRQCFKRRICDQIFIFRHYHILHSLYNFTYSFLHQNLFHVFKMQVLNYVAKQLYGEKGIIEEHTTIINPQKISGAVSSSDEMEHFLHTVIDTLPGVISCSCNTILSRIKDIKGLRL